MTTERPALQQSGRDAAWAAMLTMALGVVLTVLGAVIAGRPAAFGAGIGASMVVGTFSFGAMAMGFVLRQAPSAALLMAMMTYTLEVLVLLAVFVLLSRFGALESTIDSRWLGVTVIATTLCWTAAQILATLRTRIPAFDPPTALRTGVPDDPR